MRLEDQVCSLELAKRLKALGVKQESAFVWMRDGFSDGKYLLHERPKIRPDVGIAAFTVAEIGELLPSGYRTTRFELSVGNVWDCDHPSTVDPDDETQANTEADARAKMLIYLIEQGVVKS